MSYRIEYSGDAEEHMKELTARRQSIVLKTVDEQLINQPNVETMNRKPMRPNPIAPWELRIGDIRVYYDIIEQPQKLVNILAVGTKVRNKVYIGKEEIEL